MVEYKQGFSKPRYLCRWWMRTKPIIGKPATIIDENGKEWLLAPHEFYCPLWAKPLDFIWKIIFGNPKLVKLEG